MTQAQSAEEVEAELAEAEAEAGIVHEPSDEEVEEAPPRPPRARPARVRPRASPLVATRSDPRPVQELLVGST